MEASFVCLIILLALIQAAQIRFSEPIDRPLLYILLVSTIYYSLFGPIYWAYYQEYEFVGYNWKVNFWQAPLTLSGCSLLLSSLVVFIGRKFRPNKKYEKRHVTSTMGLRIAHIFGWSGAAYLAAVGIGTGEQAGNGDPLLLIAFQFADILIAIYLLQLSQKGWRPSVVFGFIAVSVLAILVGYRYRLVFLWLPVLAVFFVRQKIAGRIATIGAGLLGLSVLAALTLSRKKFEGIDFYALTNLSIDEVLYGLFAESNNVFGLLAIFDSMSIPFDYIYLQPLFDSVLDFIPRALYPTKDSGSYVLTYVSEGLVTDEGAKSGTAYPFVGEYLMMGGAIGAVLGTLAYSILYLVLRVKLLRNATGISGATYGVWLLATFFGYYYYSRGYMPQAAKSLVFIVLPYVYFCGALGSLRQKPINR